MKPVWGIFAFLVAACSSQQADTSALDPVVDGAEADRHCRFAITFATEGRCLAAGEQLGHCSGPLYREARAKAELACPPGATPTPEAPSPEPPDPTPPDPTPPSTPAPSPPPVSPTPAPSAQPPPPNPKAPKPPPFVIPSAIPTIPPFPGLPPPAQPLDGRQ